ncbi:sialidase family protein [Streptomyces sp. NPDC002851]
MRTLHSDDGGRSWRFGFVEEAYEGVHNAHESTAVLLLDGRLYFIARDQHGRSVGIRLDTYPT